MFSIKRYETNYEHCKIRLLSVPFQKINFIVQELHGQAKMHNLRERRHVGVFSHVSVSKSAKFQTIEDIPIYRSKNKV